MESDPERTVCFCHNVTEGELLAAIRAGARTLEQIQAQTCASTGCGGCQCEVEELLERELAPQGAQSQGEPQGEPVK
jgi:nitrite reductase (NADH) large subunit